MPSRKKILEQRIGDIAARDPRKADILIKYGLDFYCNGKQILQQAIKKNRIAVSTIVPELIVFNDADILPSRNMLYWNIDFMCDFIVNTHHHYVKNAGQMLQEYGETVVNNHRKNHPELKHVQQIILDILDEMYRHMEYEEKKIFPVMKHLWEMYLNPEKIHRYKNKIADLEKDFVKLEKEHAEVWSQVAEIKRLTSGYLSPADACVTYQIYLTKLREFEEDLINHVHLENNILFPKVITLATKFKPV